MKFIDIVLLERCLPSASRVLDWANFAFLTRIFGDAFNLKDESKVQCKQQYQHKRQVWCGRWSFNARLLRSSSKIASDGTVATKLESTSWFHQVRFFKPCTSLKKLFYFVWIIECSTSWTFSYCNCETCLGRPKVRFNKLKICVTFWSCLFKKNHL